MPFCGTIHYVGLLFRYPCSVGTWVSRARHRGNDSICWLKSKTAGQGHSILWLWLLLFWHIGRKRRSIPFTMEVDEVFSADKERYYVIQVAPGTEGRTSVWIGARVNEELCGCCFYPLRHVKKVPWGMAGLS